MSTVDWYGNVSMVVFFAGCNIRCPYCQNSALLPVDSGTEVGLDYIEERIKIGMEPVPQLDAVVFTGGEPTLQPDAVIAAAGLVKEWGLKLMLDTNGTIYEAAERVLGTGLVDRIALDVKAPLTPEDYGRVSGIPGLGGVFSESVKKTLMLSRELGIEVEARTTVAPTVSDDADFISRIAAGIKDYADVYYLQQFDNHGEVLSPELKEMESPTRERLVELAESALAAGMEPVHIKTRFGGLERIP
ncbi:anaerobic ribonucleoside-triphosphate reductase activating protein [Candidatus Bathyarchaeota archaeon]|nr:anaerobic ribonucleoside-triphosphate reductase activating protein [Candidatus Bathyarchaeota archaeon]